MNEDEQNARRNSNRTEAEFLDDYYTLPEPITSTYFPLHHQTSLASKKEEEEQSKETVKTI